VKTLVCICDQEGVHPWCPIHHPETIPVPRTEVVALFGGPRHGELEMVGTEDRTIYVDWFPELHNSMKCIKGVYRRVPYSVRRHMVFVEPGTPIFIWHLEADTTK
jgi:hypothetical protein